MKRISISIKFTIESRLNMYNKTTIRYYRSIAAGLFFLLFCTIALIGQPSESNSNYKTESPGHDWNQEVIYHVMQRSFYDSDGDLHGDLNGFAEKLDYLKELGVTTILFTPLYESGFYHNYFPTDYQKIDPEYGTMEDYIDFVRKVHDKGMKFIMDMETQYAQSGHVWFDDSYNNPESEYSDFIYYSDSLNQYPEQIFMPANSPLHEFTAWPGDKHNIVLLDLNNDHVRQWMLDFYTYWVDPNGDGNFDDGVDGFRIDHIMDDLDYKGIITNMYQDFWRPIFESCRAVNPKIFVLGEQSNWNEFGEQMIEKSGADAAFNFPLRFAIAGETGTHDMYVDPDRNGVTMDPKRIHGVVQEGLSKLPEGSFTINFLENHDTARWASVVNGNDGQMRVAALLNLFLPGTPSIYYGQELGVSGKTHEWGSDANHIPVREAFPWTSNASDKGNALWYKDSGPWWEISFWNTEEIEQLSLQKQEKNENSLWHHYKKLLQLRRDYASFRSGDYIAIWEDEEGLLAFERTHGEETVRVIINVSEENLSLVDKINAQDVVYSNGLEVDSNNASLQPYAFVIEINP